MKPLTKKILESGLVDKTTALMLERWGQLEPMAADLVGKESITKKTLEEFVSEIEALVAPEAMEVKETRLEIEIKQPPLSLWAPIPGGFAAVEDSLGRLIVRAGIELSVGDAIYKSTPGRRENLEADLTISKIEPIYQNDVVVANQLTVEPVKGE